MELIGDSGERLELAVQSCSNMDADYQWITTQINVVVGGFRASFVETIEACSLLDFMVSLNVDMKSKEPIVFSTIENSLALRGENNGFGKIIWHGRVEHPVGNGTVLTFSFEADYTQNVRLIKELEYELKKSYSRWIEPGQHPVTC